MAKKARFYLVTLRDVDHEWKTLVPAQSKTHVESELSSAHIRIVDIESYGWHDVQVDESIHGPAFYATIDSIEYEYTRGSEGYDYLAMQFHSQHLSIIDQYYS